MQERVVAAIAMGSNLGDRESHLHFARERLAGVLDKLRFSSFHETDPVGVPSTQPMFLNAAAVGETACSARELLEALLAIERARGRERPFRNAARTIDLDLILFGTQRIDETGLVVPHPRFRERRFVLAPLDEVGADLQDPVTGVTVGALLAALGEPG